MINRKTERWFALAVVISIFVLGAGSYGASLPEDAGGEADEKLHIMQIQGNSLQTDSITETEMKIRWNDFLQNLNSTSTMLTDWRTNNSTREEAFLQTTSILALNTQSITDLESMQPSDEYQKLYTYTLEGIKSLNVYLWYMAKFFQTGNGSYIGIATEKFNVTLDYYELGKEEVEFLF